MKKKFTLIELIVVIAVLGILAVIVIPNIANMKDKTIKTAVIADTRVLQTAADMYQIDNNSVLPTVAPPTKQLPQAINFAAIYPEQLRNLPKVDGVKYWMDVNGTVWSSFEDMPQGFNYDSTTGNLSWNKVANASGYEIQEVVKSDATSDLVRSVVKYKTIKKVMDVGAVTFKGEPNKSYAISSIDKYGFPSAPIGTGVGYESGYQDTLESVKKGQSGGKGEEPSNPALPESFQLTDLTYSVVEETNVVNVLGKSVSNADVKVTFPDGQTVNGKANADGTFSVSSSKAMETDGKILVEVVNSKGEKKNGELAFASKVIENALYTWERTKKTTKSIYRAVPMFTNPNPEFYPEKKAFSYANQYYGIAEGTIEPFEFLGTDNVYVARSGDNFLVSKQNFDGDNWNGMNLKTYTTVDSSSGLGGNFYKYYGSRTLTSVVTKEQADKIYPSYVDTYNGYNSPFEKDQLYLMVVYNSGLEFNSKDHITFKKLELVEQVSDKNEFKEIVTSNKKDAYPQSGLGSDGYSYVAKKTVDSTKYFDNAGLPLEYKIKMNVLPKEIGTNTPVTLSFITPYSAISGSKYDKIERKLDGNLLAGTSESLRYNSLPAGEHVIETRVHQTNGGWSEWVSKTFTVQDKVIPLPQIAITERDTSGVTQTGYYDNYTFTSKVAFNVKNGAAVRILNDNGNFVSEYSFGNDFGRNASYTITPNGDLAFWRTTQASGAYYQAIVLDESGTITDSIRFYMDGYSSGTKPNQSSKIDVQYTYDATSVTIKASKPASSVYPTTASVSLNEIYTKPDGTKGELITEYNNSGSYYNSGTRNVDLTKVFTFKDLKPKTTYKLTVNSSYQNSTTSSTNYQYYYFTLP